MCSVEWRRRVVKFKFLALRPRRSLYTRDYRVTLLLGIIIIIIITSFFTIFLFFPYTLFEIYIHTYFFIGFDRCRRTPSAVCEKCPWRYRVDRTDYQDINYPAKHMHTHTHTHTLLAEESCKDLLSRYSLPLSMISVGELKLVQIPTDKKKIIIIMVIIKEIPIQYSSIPVTMIINYTQLLYYISMHRYILIPMGSFYFFIPNERVSRYAYRLFFFPFYLFTGPVPYI